MAQLAIRGHEKRGKEVIKILEMLGGKKTIELSGNATTALYSIFNDRLIDYFNESRYNKNETEIFTLEEFLEKFPHKVGDEVKNARINDFIGRIINARWDDNEKQIIYTVEWDDASKSTLNYYARGLQPYKEETMEEKPDLLQQLKEYFETTPREVIEKEWHEYDKYNEIGLKVNEYLEYVNDIRHPKYPKTYEECCKVLDYCGDYFLTTYDNNEKPSAISNILNSVNVLTKLLICRNAYWKIAGEQMGLGKTWEPNWKEDDGGYRYCICNLSNKIILHNEWLGSNCILSFPIAEMRDAFKENFDKDIEFCKEFL